MGGLDGMAELPGVAPAVGGGIGMAAHHREGSGRIAGQGVDGGRKGPEGPVQPHADGGRILAGPFPAAGGEHLAEHLIRHGVDSSAALVRSSRPWAPIASHSLPSAGL